MAKKHTFSKPYDNLKELKTHLNIIYGTDIFKDCADMNILWAKSDVPVPPLVYYTLGYIEYFAYQYDEEKEIITLWIDSPNVKK